MAKRVVSVPKTKKISSVCEQQLRVAAYCRVSTGSEEQQYSLKNQIEYYSDYIQRQANWILVNLYSDTASGIRTKKRDGYQQKCYGHDVTANGKLVINLDEAAVYGSGTNKDFGTNRGRAI